MGRPRALAFLPLALALVGGGVIGTVPATSQGLLDCGLTTLEGTVVESDDEDGILECGPGQPLTVREELAAAGSGREAARVPLGSFFTLSDFQYADEESPLRGEWADKCGEHPATSAFRPHETMVGHMMEAHVRAASRIAANGGPVLGAPFDLAMALGDLADNQQYNETRFFIDVLDGGDLVDPDSGDEAILGGDGYDGVQTSDPEGDPGNPLGSPVDGETIRDLANEPFLATGLRNADGTPIPWYTVMGNHDMKVQGTISDDNSVWRELVRGWVLGRIKIMDLDPDKQQEACEGGFTDPAFWTELLTACQADPAACGGTTRIVPQDLNRRLLDRVEWIAEHFTTRGVPVGHGLGDEGRRCPVDSYPSYAPRACYTFDQGPFRFIVLDTTAAEGLESGNVDEAQFHWLEDQLEAASRSYLGTDGGPVENAAGTDRLIVVTTHHTISSTTNNGPRTGLEPGSRGELFDGEDLKQLLLRFPNVILQVSGHTHQNKIWAHQNEELGTGYWEVNTAAVADYPTQSRTIEIADNGDGTLSIFAVTFDAAVPPNPRDIAWMEDDHTHETEHGAMRDVNEDWLASAGREVQYHDPQQDLVGKLGTPEDRNVELLIARPFGPAAGGPPVVPGPGGGQGGALSVPGQGEGSGGGTAGQPATCLAGRFPGANLVLGTDGPDRLTGTAGPDLICGFGGGDRIRGRDGKDVLVGGPARDLLLGGRGSDLLIGGGARDLCKGGPGTDRQRLC